MRPPKSKVVVPASKPGGVLAAMTRLAGYNVTPVPDPRPEEDEFKRARKATMAAAAEAVLVSRSRPVQEVKRRVQSQANGGQGGRH